MKEAMPEDLTRFRTRPSRPQPRHIGCLALALFGAGLCATAISQAVPSKPAPRSKWTAMWISHPSAPLREPLTLHLRRTFQAAAGTKHYIVHVSADNRFILYLNGQRIADGPARGDLAHWRYETIDLAPNLHAGENVLSATVWNFGVYASVAQMSDRTAFLLQGDTDAESSVNTNDQWMVELEPGQVALPREPRGFWTYMAAGPGEKLLADAYDWTWQTEPAVAPRWTHAAPAMRDNIYASAGIAASRGVTADNPWQLVPDPLPPMSYLPVPAGRVVRTDLPAASGFPATAAVIPAHSHGHILLDRASLTTAYPKLGFSGGAGASIQLIYAEALYDAAQKKGDRDEVGTRQALGTTDMIFPDGGQHRSFEPLWWRTWRFLDLEVTTGDASLTLDSLAANYTAYPLAWTAHFTSSDPELDSIWKIGRHTLELDAHETFMDTPYYEQLQYVGDARVEAMITYALTGDDRLPREAMRAIDESRRADGLTTSRYPSSLPQYIPPFSLLWIGMMRDYATYRQDPAFIQEMLPGSRAVLAWFSAYERPNGLLSKLPYWSFVDWTQDGVLLPSYDRDGQSCLVTLEYAGALADAEELERLYGNPQASSEYSLRLRRVKEGVMRSCWDPARGLVADTPDRTVFSQHSNALAVLYDVVPRDQQAAVMNRVLASASQTASATGSLIPASYYFQFYLARALQHANLSDRYFELADIWRGLARQHFTTWPETSGDTRSDSHAWSAHPTLDLLTLVAGIAPAAPGFAAVHIEPHLGPLTSLDAVMAHPLGDIHVVYALKGRVFSAKIDLPAGLAGDFAWKGHEQPLHGGTNSITFKE